MPARAIHNFPGTLSAIEFPKGPPMGAERQLRALVPGEPGRLLRVVPGLEPPAHHLRSIDDEEHGDPGVHARAVCPEEGGELDVEAGLLAGLAAGRLLGRLAVLHEARRQAPAAGHGLVLPAHEQDLLVTLD